MSKKKQSRCKATKKVGKTTYRCGKKAYHSGYCGKWKRSYKRRKK